jgi:hypothetical protein
MAFHGHRTQLLIGLIGLNYLFAMLFDNIVVFAWDCHIFNPLFLTDGKNFVLYSILNSVQEVLSLVKKI